MRFIVFMNSRACDAVSHEEGNHGHIYAYGDAPSGPFKSARDACGFIGCGGGGAEPHPNRFVMIFWTPMSSEVDLTLRNENVASHFLFDKERFCPYDK